MSVSKYDLDHVIECLELLASHLRTVVGREKGQELEEQKLITLLAKLRPPKGEKNEYILTPVNKLSLAEKTDAAFKEEQTAKRVKKLAKQKDLWSYDGELGRPWHTYSPNDQEKYNYMFPHLKLKPSKYNANGTIHGNDFGEGFDTFSEEEKTEYLKHFQRPQPKKQVDAKSKWSTMREEELEDSKHLWNHAGVLKHAWHLYKSKDQEKYNYTFPDLQREYSKYDAKGKIHGEGFDQGFATFSDSEKKEYLRYFPRSPKEEWELEKKTTTRMEQLNKQKNLWDYWGELTRESDRYSSLDREKFKHMFPYTEFGGRYEIER
jgi:hypothetical protein